MSKKKKIVILSVCICLALVVMGGTVAWYSRQDAKRARTEGATVMAPYNLYLLNPDAKDLLEFAVGNLHPGEKKQTVICVSNKRPERPEDSEDPENPENPDDDSNVESEMSALAKDSKFGYDLMLVYTENLAINYTIYPLERHDIADLPEGDVLDEDDYIMDDSVVEYYWTKKLNEDEEESALEGEFMTDDMRASVGTDEPGIVNAGAYWISTDDTMELEYKVNENGEDKYEHDYYLIEIDWKKDINFESYRKETDMVYVVVNAKQPRPILEDN